MSGPQLNERACAVISLATRLAWTPDFPQPLARAAVHRMISTGELRSLVLCEAGRADARRLARARALLTRVSAVHAGMEAYARAGYRLMMPGDALWPDALGALGEQMPLFLFARGNEEILSGRRIAVAGSRHIERRTRDASEETGRRIAREGAVLVTGGAQGVDSAALSGALGAGGMAIIVPALPVAQLLQEAEWVQALEAGRLLILCDALPDEPFSAAKALSRNHTIYALGDAALVVAAREGKGGSWRGAHSCLHGGWSPVHVWAGTTADTAGNRALEALGAKPYALGGALLCQLTAKQAQLSLFDGREERVQCW